MSETEEIGAFSKDRFVSEEEIGGTRGEELEGQEEKVEKN
jgi:hypothetical protein